MRIIKFIPLIAFIFLATFFLIKIIYFESTKEISSALINKPFPQISLENYHGEHSFNKLIGTKPIVINYFASWCVPCRQEHNTLKYFSNENTIIGIAYKDSKDNIEKFLNELGNPYKEVFLDNSGRSAIELGLYGVPETYFVDKKGIIRYKHIGPIDQNEFNKLINLLKNN